MMRWMGIRRTFRTLCFSPQRAQAHLFELFFSWMTWKPEHW